MTVIEENLLTVLDYTPYCGNQISSRDIGGCDNPRLRFNGVQFSCPACSYMTDFEPEFIGRYKKAQEALREQPSYLT